MLAQSGEWREAQVARARNLVESTRRSSAGSARTKRHKSDLRGNSHACVSVASARQVARQVNSERRTAASGVHICLE